MSDLPAPPAPAECETFGLGDMPFSLSAFRRTALVRTRNATAFRAGFELMLVSWYQTPAGSIDDDDQLLAALAGFRRTRRALNTWLRVREDALKGWVACSDGRLYEPNIVAVALDRWTRKLCSDAARALRRADTDDINRCRRRLTAAHAALAKYAPAKARAARWIDRLDPNAERRRQAGEAALRLLSGGRA